MRATIENLLHVTPSVFFERLFFDEEYNRGLYDQLGFSGYEVLELRREADGRVQRLLRADPPLNLPALVKRRIQGRFYYTETGTFDPQDNRWSFRTVPSIQQDHVRIQGEIRLIDTPGGSRHLCDLTVDISAWGLGPLIERVVERNTRDSYRVTTEYTNAYARAQGLTAVPAGRAGAGGPANSPDGAQP